MKRFWICVCAFLAVAHLAVRADAVIMPGTVPLPQAISSAEVIVVANIVVETPDVPSATDHNLTPGQISPPSQYVLHSLKCIKGKCPDNLKIHLPELEALNYGGGYFKVNKGDNVLLILNRSSDGSFAPVDTATPLIRLANEQLFSVDKVTTVSVQSETVNTILDSLSDASLRTANIAVLKDVVDPNVILKIFPYLDSSDPDLCSAVAYCMATNQQVAAIPRIAQLCLAAEKQEPDSGSLIALCLSKYRTENAVFYLNPLVISPNYRLRSVAVSTLYKISDRTSIPYLILALRDPDPSQNIPGAADVALHHIIPALGPVLLSSREAFIKHRDEEIERVNEWWSDELNEKHTKLSDQTAALTSPASQTELHVPLFSPATSTRREAALKLEKDADANSVPYLVLALQDPDDMVVYSAYKTLHRLVSDLGPAVMTDEQFRSNRESEIKHIYSWWNTYLSPKPFQRPDTTGFISVPDKK